MTTEPRPFYRRKYTIWLQSRHASIRTMRLRLNGGKRALGDEGIHMQSIGRGAALRCVVVQRIACALLLGLLVLPTASSIVVAQDQRRTARLSANQQEALRERLNESTLMLATSPTTASTFAMGNAISALLGTADGLRVLPVPTEGGIDTLRDLLFLRGMDMAIVPANALVHAKTTEALGPGLPQRIGYITQLYGEEVHLLAGSGAKDINDLRGKKVAVPEDDGSALFTLRDLFSRLGLGIEAVKMPLAQALNQIRSGEIAAVLLLAGKPMPALSVLPKDGSIRLLALPFTPALEEAYAPGAFRADDYPTLIPPGMVVETVAVSAVLLARTERNDEERAQRVAKFVPQFFNAMTERPPLERHAKWREVNLAATVAGWSRVPAAEEWLRKAQQEQAQALQRSFEAFLRETQPAGAPTLTAAQRKRLFDEFVSWTRKSVSEPSTAARP
jgi:uncharacterized protein